ncbi:hypothetical protein CHUAL_013836 [Chamberlinius hualienensis]
MASKRALHFVFKIGDRAKTIKFYKEVLGMKVLRHEEFDEGCKASCNGPYDGKWSKTMVGYGSEDDHFVVELTYNYGISSYQLGNDFRSLTVWSQEAVEDAKKHNLLLSETNEILAPDGYKFVLVEKPQPTEKDPVKMVSLNVYNLQRSLDYWHRLCGLTLFKQEEKRALLGFDAGQCQLELVDIGEEIKHATAFGRIAFARPTSELAPLEKVMKNANQTILTSLVTLQTPGKADVQVVILADPDGHEICFVGTEGFNELAQFDPEGDKKLEVAMAADQSNQWFASKGLSKASA